MQPGPILIPFFLPHHSGITTDTVRWTGWRGEEPEGSVRGGSRGTARPARQVRARDGAALQRRAPTSRRGLSAGWGPARGGFLLGDASVMASGPLAGAWNSEAHRGREKEAEGAAEAERGCVTWMSLRGSLPYPAQCCIFRVQFSLTSGS